MTNEEFCFLLEIMFFLVRNVIKNVFDQNKHFFAKKHQLKSEIK